MTTFTLINDDTGQPVTSQDGARWEHMAWPAGAVVEIYDTGGSWARVSPGAMTVGGGSTTIDPPPPPPPPALEPDPPGPTPLPPATTNNFAAELVAAFIADRPFNWFGGDVLLKQPITLIADQHKLNFHVNANDANIFCDFNDAGKYAITARIQGGNVNIRSFGIEELKFRGVSAFAGAVLLECLRNDSWIYQFDLAGMTCEGHQGHAFWLRGSVFECDLEHLGSEGGLGLLRATTDGSLDPNGQVGLPSALVGRSWRPRDFLGDAVLFDSTKQYAEPFDLRLTDGYFVTGQGSGRGITAPAGINTIEGVGFENIKAQEMIFLGYRGGRVIRCQGTNANITKYLVRAQLAGNSVTLAGCSVDNENEGSGMKLAKVEDLGNGSIILDPSRSDFNGNDVETNVPNDRFNIVSYRKKT